MIPAIENAAFTPPTSGEPEKLSPTSIHVVNASVGVGGRERVLKSKTLARMLKRQKVGFLRCH